VIIGTCGREMHTEVVRQRIKRTYAKREDIFETDVKEVRRYSVVWIHMAHSVAHWWVIVNTALIKDG
jgi:membrane glycosyltransferase